MSKEMPRLAVASGLCLAIAGIPALGAEHKFDGVYIGRRSLTEGSVGPMCLGQKYRRRLVPLRGGERRPMGCKLLIRLRIS